MKNISKKINSIWENPRAERQKSENTVGSTRPLKFQVVLHKKKRQFTKINKAMCV